MVLNLVRAGVRDYIAAEAAGVPARTFRDWMARGEGTHPTRSATPKLRRFAQAVNQANAEARASAEIRVFEKNPALWLSRAARSKPGREGWTELRAEVAEEISEFGTLEQRVAAADAREREEAARRARQAVAECKEGPNCPCSVHQRRYDDEYKRHIGNSD